MPITKLSQDVINKIAAGEVVERPGSVVKELIENALDAQASNIILELRDGGKRFIRMTDDGIGMRRDDVINGLERYATSKIESIDDLYRLNTFGFRGEALASISSVSKFTLQTKSRSDLTGSQASMDGGERRFSESALPDGTTVIVDDLFYNIPARKKFLKNESTEFSHCLKIFTDFSLLFFQKGFQCFHNGKKVVHYFPQNLWMERVKEVLGSEVGKNLVSFQKKIADYEVSGFFADPRIHRAHRQSQFLFVNQRSVFDAMISRAFKDAFANVIPKGEYPVFVCRLDVSPHLLDVNVHPRKSEVKFLAPQTVYRLIVSAVEEKMKNDGKSENFKRDVFSFRTNPVSQYSQAMPSAPVIGSFSTSDSGRGPKNFSQVTISETMKFQKALLQDTDIVSETPKIQSSITESQDEWRLLGQIHDSYLLVEVCHHLMIIDQHAAAERILFDRMSDETVDAQIQALLLPITLEVSAQEMSVLGEHVSAMKGVGFDIEVFGVNTFLISGVPSAIVIKDVKKVIIDMVEDISDESFAKLSSVEEKKEAIKKSAACRAAVKFGDRLTSAEQVALLSDIRKHRVISCPHGRPCMWNITWDELAKKFQRP